MRKFLMCHLIIRRKISQHPGTAGILLCSFPETGPSFQDFPGIPDLKCLFKLKTIPLILVCLRFQAPFYFSKPTGNNNLHSSGDIHLWIMRNTANCIFQDKITVSTSVCPISRTCQTVHHFADDHRAFPVLLRLPAPIYIPRLKDTGNRPEPDGQRPRCFGDHTIMQFAIRKPQAIAVTASDHKFHIMMPGEKFYWIQDFGIFCCQLFPVYSSGQFLKVPDASGEETGSPIFRPDIPNFTVHNRFGIENASRFFNQSGLKHIR